MLSFLGRYSDRFWALVGPYATRAYLRRYLREQEEVVLNLGGGTNLSAVHLTADITPRADVYMDVTEPLPLEDEKIEAIVLEEVIEHIPADKGRQLVRECYRVLKPSGHLRITTPDLEYLASDVLDREQGHLINWVFYNHGHEHIYTEDEVITLCKTAGFESVRASNYRDEETQLGSWDTHAYRFTHPPELSLYVEAQK
jgi:predicted SAM-dependent methyltransferase